MKKLLAFAMILGLSSMSFAHRGDVSHVRNDDLFLTGSFLILTALTNHDHGHHHKIAIENAAPEALDVLAGQTPGDLFLEGKLAAEDILGKKYDSDLQAASDILEVTQQLQEEAAQ